MKYQYKKVNGLTQYVTFKKWGCWGEGRIDKNNFKVSEYAFLTLILGSKITADGDCSHEIERCLLLGEESYHQPRQHIKKQRHYFVNKGPSSEGYGLSSGHLWM